MFIISGAFFQMGVLVYMVTAALWALGQSFWTIRVMPTPGSPAYDELVERRHAKYIEWAKPFFDAYDAKRAQLPTAADDASVVELNDSTWQEASKRAKELKVATDFPEAMTSGDKVSILRNLAVQEWTTLPDELWMRGVRHATEKAETRKEAQAKREQHKRLSREERLAQAKRQRRLDAEREARKKKAASPVENLSAEKLERRRQERRKARRRQNKKKR